MKEYNNKKRNSVFGGIGVAALLCVLMVLMSWSAMVTNSDINSIVTENSETQDVKTDNTVKSDVESPMTNFEAEIFGFEEENEMLGMRTVNSKTYLDEDGKLNAVVSNKALHYENHLGQLIDLDTSIKTWDNGFYVEDIYTPVYFGIHAYDGLIMHLGDSELSTGINPVPVIVKTGLPSEVQLPGLKGEMVNSVEEISNEYFTAPTEFVEIGGSSISYPMTSNMDLVYHVSENLVKQELILESLTPDFELYLEESTVKTADAESMESMFGLKETMVLPEGTQLWAGNHLITADDGVFEYNSELLIKDSTTGQIVAFIQAPVAMDGSPSVKESELITTETKSDATYFIHMDQDGINLDFITAVSTDWLLDESTLFPVVIDPSVGSNTATTLTTPGNYGVCVVEDVDCYTRTDGRYEHDYGSGMHEFSPWFDFSFTQGTALTVAQVNAYISWSSRIWSQSGDEFTSIQIMEDCGGTLPDGDEANLNNFANPAGCTGTALQAYTPPPPAPGAPTTYTFADFHPSWGTGDFQYYSECASNGYIYSLTSDMTSCQYGSSYDWIGVGGSGSASGPEENGGIFSSGSYTYLISDSAGDNLDGGASIHFETRTIGSTTWNTVQSESGYVGSNGIAGSITVASGDELRLAYNCPPASWNCYPGENSMTITPYTPPPTIPAIGAGAGGTPTGTEAATTTFNLAGGEEAYMSFTTGQATGDAEETEIYYRMAGSTGWSDVWDLCTGTTCTPATQYESYLATTPILFQTPGTYELLVWDTFGDGSGTGSGGTVIIAAAGSAGLGVQNSPSGLRLVSLVSTEQIGTFQISTSTATNRAIQLCGSVTDCNTGAMGIFVDAYKNTGYLEFALGFPNGANNPNGPITGNRDGGAYFSDFYLVVELEDTTPDSTPPTVEYDGHYTGFTTYIDGPKTLFLSLMDTNNPIDTTTANSPKLHYSVDGGNSYTIVTATSSGTCNSKNQVCGFSALTGDLTAGDTVDYYWTYTDAAANDNTKIPPQTPNPGRFPASGSADLTFTIADKYSAPTDGSDMKIVTYMDNIRSAEPHTGVSSAGYAADVDRQMTYYTNSGEFHFEFGLDNCGTSFPGSGGFPGTDGQGSCFFDIDYYTSFGEQAGHWDINWEGVANDCSPGVTGCTGAATNNLELDSYFGGPLGISRAIGAGNLIFVYDNVNNAWAIAGSGTGLSNPLDSALPDVNSMSSFTSNIVTPVGPTPVRSLISSGMSGAGGLVGPITIAPGDVGRIGYYDGGCCNTEQGVTVEDTSTGAIYNVGRTYYSSWRSAYQVPSQYVSSPCTSSTCSFGYTSGGSYSWSNSLDSSVNNNLPNNGVLAAGTYNIYFWDTYGDSTDGNMLYLETIAATAGFSSAPSGPYETNLYNGRSTGTTAYQAQSYIIDLSATSAPTLGTNTGFGGVSFGAGTGEFSMICVTTAGHVMFMDSELQCVPDATESSAGGQWQGFALGAGKTNFQYNGNGMLWQVRDVAPDPDTNAPSITGGAIGDSHSLDRTITATISDTASYDTGLDVSPVPGVGPTLHMTVTSDTGVVTTSLVALQPVGGDRNACVETACEWTADISGLARGDTVSYYITSKDTYPPGANSVTTATTTFDVANPTNTLVVEWHEYAYSSSASQPCSMQVVMYDVTNEFEYHYDDNCYVDDIVGLVGVREDSSNSLQVRNDPTSRYSTYTSGTDPGNPHMSNIRFTLDDSGEYVYEYFDLGMDFLPLASSSQTIPVRSTTFSNDNNCDSNADFASNGLYCAGNFDIPDDFDFEFYGDSYSGADSNNRIHVIGSGMLYFIDNGDTGTYRHETGWNSNGAMYDIDSSSTLFPDEMMSPWWSRETMDYCYSSGSRTCEGVWYRTLPFDGQGKTVTADIVDDTTWYLIDSPIKVNPTSTDGYLSITADLTIQPGVEIIIGEDKGISFDGGLQADGTCAQFTAIGSGSDRITFDVDTSLNANALWHGLAFTNDCGGQGETGRHNFDMVDISNTNHAAIQAGSRPADPNGPSCGTAQQDCDIGEFVMNDVTYSNVDSAFSHGSGQGTVVTMSNFAVNNARSACFNFAENTIATLTGTAGSPSTMNGCNTDGYSWGGAVVNMPGSTSGELIMSYVDIVDSDVSLIRVDLQKVTISDVTATTTNNVNWNPDTSSTWNTENSGVSIALSHGANSEVMITNFDAQNYHHGWICAVNSIQLNNVNLGTGFANDHYFDINPHCGAITSSAGTYGADSVFDGFTVPDLTMFRTFPGTANDIQVSGELKMSEFAVSGAPSDAIEITDSTVVGKFISDGCDANIEISESTFGQLDSFCPSAVGSSSISMVDSEIAHTTTNSAIYLQQTNGIFVNVTVTSSTISASGPYLAYADFATDLFLIDVKHVDGTGTSFDCADVNGKTLDCFTGKTGSAFGPGIPEIYYGAFANSLAYRLGQDTSTTPPTSVQIPESGVTITASTLDSSGAEILPSRVIYKAVTGADGRTDTVAVITGDDDGNVFDSHIVRASGAAGAGEVNPVLADGTPATDVEFSNGVLYQAPAVLAVNAYTMGNDISFTDGVTLLSAITTYESGNAPAGTLTWSWQSMDPSTTGSFDPDQDTSTGRVYWKSIAYADATVLTGTNGYDRVYYGGDGVAAGNDINGPVTAATETYNFVPFDDEFGTYTIGSYADVRLLSPPVTFDDSNMNCAWMATNDTFSNAVDVNSGNYVFKGATMVLAGDMDIDGCTVELQGSKLIFREDSTNNPTLTISNLGTLLMTLDSDTGDLPKVYGEGNLDAVDVVIGAGGTLDMQTGTMKNFILGQGKAGQLEVPTGATLNMAGGAYLTSSDLSTSGSNDFPMLNVNGGIVTVSNAFLAGSSNLGIGVALTNAGEISGDSLTVSNMLTGIDSNGGSLNLDGYTSTANSNGVVAQDGPKLPQVFTSAVLEGITSNYPQINFGNIFGEIPGMNNCFIYHMYGCYDWEEYTVDLSSWVGQEDFLQPSMMINYGGTGFPTWTYHSTGGQYPYVALDNLMIKVTDVSGNQYVIDGADDVGYYPYGTNDAAIGSTLGTTTVGYQGGLGGIPFWDCNYLGTTLNPWRYGTNMYYNYYSSSVPSVGGLFGMSSNGYPDEFGFRVGVGDTPEPISVSSRPLFTWGYDDPIDGRFGPGLGNINNAGSYHDTSTGATRPTGTNYEACLARAQSSSTVGSNMLLEWPTLDLRDPSIEKVELQFDMWHRYTGAWANWNNNNNPDNVEVLARAGSNPANFGTYSEAVAGKGVTLVNSIIDGATVGVDLKGDTIAVLNNVDIDNPVAYGVRTAGANNIYIDGLNIADSSAGANSNIGFYTESTSSGKQSITNSNFNGLETAVYLTNDVDTTVSNTVLSNGATGLKVGSQSSANHNFDTLTINNNNVGIQADGTGSLTMVDVDLNSVTTDVDITDGNTVTFLDGIVDSNLVAVDSSSTGTFNRDRSYTAVLSANGNPLDATNVVMSSRDAATSTSGTTDASGVTEGLAFSIYDIDGTGTTDYSALFNTYTLSSVAMVSYSWTDTTTNDADFRYIQTTPTLSDGATDSGNGVNYEQFAMIDPIDVRICGSDSNHVVIAPCSGTLSGSSSRTYTNGMIEYGDIEGFNDGTSSLDLTGKAIMIDTGNLVLKDGVNYILDNAIVFDTGYTTEYGSMGITEWTTDVPYGVTITMNGGEINGLYPKTENGDVVGLIIGGLQGSGEGALNLDIDGVNLNNVVGFATGTGDRTASAFTGSYNTYVPSIVDIENSFINHYRGYYFYPTLYSDLDYCVRLSGTTSATIAGNTFSDCTIGVSFFDSNWNSGGSTSVGHEQIGSDNVVIDGNTFVGSSGYNVMAWTGSDTDLTQITNNVMSCNTCIHVRYMDDTSVMPTISDNVFNGGRFGVYTDETEFVTIDNNVFNNQENIAIRAQNGDFDASGNTINNPGTTAILADSLEKPGEIVESIVAGVNSPQPDDGVSYISWTSSCGGWGNGVQTGGPQCTSPDVTAVLGSGEEMIIRLHEGGSWISELRVNYKDPSGTLGQWNPGSEGDTSNVDGNPSGLIFSTPGVYFFNLEDTYGDGANGGGFEVIKSQTGAWTATGNTNPPQFWDPGVAGLLTTEPTSYSAGYSWNPNYANNGYSNTMDGVIIENNGADPVDYELVGIDTYGDGFDGGWIRAQTAAIGTWSVATTGTPPQAGNTGGGIGTTMAQIGGYAGGTAFPVIEFPSGTYSQPVTVTLNAGDAMRFEIDCSSWCGELALQIQESQAVDNSWDGPTISNNDINFDSVNNNPNAIGLDLTNCDVQDYTITTQSNTIDIGQNAVVNNGCSWFDIGSTITGFDLPSSMGYNDDNTFNVDLSLDGTTISGFETGLYKAGGGTLTITNGATITAGAGGMGVHTDGIDVSVIGATFDGGATGTGIMIENSNYAWLYPMDLTGNIGLHAVNSEILWDGGSTDASTSLLAENVRGTVQSITDAGGTQIDAQTDSRLTVIDFPLDETRMLVDATSIVDEANWLDIDANHLGAEPTASVGLSIISDGDYTAYSSPVFEGTMVADGASDDWFGNNVLNPSGYAMPGAIGGPMYLTNDAGNLFFGLDSISSATSDVYIYIDSNDMAGSTTGFNGVHSLPYAADYAVVVTSTSTDVYYYNDPAWVLDPTANAISAEGSYLEIAVPVSSIGGTSADSMTIVATVQNVGTDDVSAVSPLQSTVGTGAETLTEGYELVMNKLDLADGTIDNEVLIHRSFEFSNVPTAANNYQVMVKTAAEARHTCQYDWATESNVAMSTSKTLTFDILRACPEITGLLDDVRVAEDSGTLTYDLSTFVDDEQDDEATMLWDVSADNMDAFAGILTDFTDLTSASGTFTVTPINDQFGTVELTYDVVDSHGLTASKTIVYTVLNINDAPVICDARIDADPDCDNGNVYLYADGAGNRFNSRDEGFTSYTKPLGKVANDTINSFIRDMANEQDPVDQVYTWGAAADCDQIDISLQTNVNGVDELVIIENQAWEEGGICDITLTLEDDGAENQQANSVVIPFSVTPVNDEPVIAVSGQVPSADTSNSFTGELNGNYRVTLVEDTTDSDQLTFDLSAIKSDIDHVDADLTWVLEDTNTCTSSNYYSHSIVGDTLSFDLIADATTNAEPWEVDMLNNNGIHQTRTANGYCEMTLTLSDSPAEPSYMPNYTALTPNNYVQESVSVTLAIKVDNVVENVPDYYLDDVEGFDFNGVNNIMPGTWVPVDFSINAGGDDGAYTYDHLLKVTLQSDGHTEVQLPRLYTPPAFGTSLDIDDWEIYVTDQTTEVWVEVDVVTCNPGQVCTPASNSIQSDSPESHNAVSGNQVFGKWSEPGRIGESADGTQSNRRPAFEDKNWCNNLMTSNAAGTTVAWSESSQCGHTEQGYGGAVLEDWQTGDNKLPTTVSTIGALSVASFAPSIIAVALTGMFVSALVLSGRRDDDEEEFMEETISDDESAVSPVIATILMVAITVVLSGVVYVWAAQLADTDTKGVPVVTFSAENVDTGSTDSDHWKITIGQAQTVLATQAVEVTVAYINATGGAESQTINLASTLQVYGFSPYNSDSLVTFGDVVTIDGEEVISTFSTGDDIYVKTHLSDGTPLVDATIRIIYNPPGDAEGATLKTYRGLSWNQAV